MGYSAAQYGLGNGLVVLRWLTYFVTVMLLVPWPWWALLVELSALAHWTLVDPDAGHVWREAFGAGEP